MPGLFKFGRGTKSALRYDLLPQGETARNRTKVSRTRSSRRVGRILFFIPVFVVLAIIAFAFATSLTVQTGTLVVMAKSSGPQSVALHPAVSVGSTTQIAPFNISLPQSQYTVVLGPHAWYKAPPPRTLLLSLGKTEYAVGVYTPATRGIAVSQNGFNSSTVTALHGVTPVVWVNVGSSPVSIEISGVGRLLLNPAQNFTAIFSSVGTFGYDVPGSGFSGSVQSL